MKFSIFTGMTGTTWDEILTLWRHADPTGWDAACVTDHFMPNTADRVGDTLECWTALAALAGLTTRLRVGTIVSGNTYRHPALLAKMATNVDIISRGRLICGVGAGWQENEHRAYGMDFYTVRERLARLDEACHVLKALWTEAKADYKGRYYQLDEQAREPRLAHHGDRRGGRHRAQAAQRGHRLEHVAQRARVNDQEPGFHLTSRVAARSIQPP